MSLPGRLYYRFCQTRAGHRITRSVASGMRRCGWPRDLLMPLDALGLDHQSSAGLMDLWTRIHWSSGDGMMPPDQLLAIYEMAATGPGHGDIVELGSWVGLTTSYLATACRVRNQGRVHAVDTFEGTKEGGCKYPSVEKFGGQTLNAFNDTIEQAGVTDLVDIHVGYTNDIAHTYNGPPIRMLLIDADHSYEAVRTDFELWSPYVIPGGLIVFHDYLLEGVAKFIDNDLASDDRFELSPGLVVPNVMAVTKKVEVHTMPRTQVERGARVPNAVDAGCVPDAPTSARTRNCHL